MEKASGDSLNGLKFGEKIYFEDVSGSGSSSKSMASPGKKPSRCLVEGCNLDLTGAKAYYSKHKVCGMHSKSPKVMVAGLEQRFCQQCSRFHLLPEFDQGKRSCRRRLAGHNERRRKPPLGPLPSRYTRLMSFHEDSIRYRSFLMDFNYPRPPNTARDAANNLWPGFVNPQPITLCSSPELKPGDFLAGVQDSCRALSLLSTQPWGAASAASEVTAPLRNIEASVISSRTEFNGIPMAQSNISSIYIMNNSWAFKDEESGISSLAMGIRHMSETADDHFSGELELSLQGNRLCPDEFGHHEVYGRDHHAMHWSF